MNGGYLSESEAFLIGMALGYSQYGDNGLASFRLVEYNSPGAPSLKLQGPFLSTPCLEPPPDFSRRKVLSQASK